MDSRTRGTVELSRPLAPVPGAVPEARGVLRDLVAAWPFARRLEDGELALSELVTNALLHGREPIEVALRLSPKSLPVEVRDANPVSPSFSMLTQLDVDALLASWADELTEDPALETVRVVLTDLDVDRVARAEAHVEALLRELALLLSTAASTAEERRSASNVLTAAAAVDPVRVELRRRLAVDEADRLSRTGRLLTAPAPLELTHARRAYLPRVLAQLGS